MAIRIYHDFVLAAADVSQAERFFEQANRHYAQAEHFFVHALCLDPDDAAAQRGMGNVLYAQRKLDEAYVACSRAWIG